MDKNWGKEIIETRVKLKNGHFDEAVSILMKLASSKNPEYAKESKNLLVKKLGQIETFTTPQT
jgi:hypothetical protein